MSSLKWYNPQAIITQPSLAGELHMSMRKKDWKPQLASRYAIGPRARWILYKGDGHQRKFLLSAETEETTSERFSATKFTREEMTLMGFESSQLGLSKHAKVADRIKKAPNRPEPEGRLLQPIYDGVTNRKGKRKRR